MIATSNKADLWTHTALLRSRDTDEQVWTFDPQEITRDQQSFVWDALTGVTTVADARRLAGHFIQEVRCTADQGDFWDRDAEDLLTGLLLAAALNRSPLSQVGVWLTSVSSVQPRNILAALFECKRKLPGLTTRFRLSEHMLCSAATRASFGGVMNRSFLPASALSGGPVP